MKTYIIISFCTVGVFFFVIGLTGIRQNNRPRFDQEDRLPVAAGASVLTLGLLLLKYR